MNTEFELTILALSISVFPVLLTLNVNSELVFISVSEKEIVCNEVLIEITDSISSVASDPQEINNSRVKRDKY